MNYEPLLDQAAIRRDPDNSLIIPNRTFSFSIINAIIILLSSMIGHGIIANSKHFKCGVIYLSLIHVFIAVITYYSCWCILYTMKIIRKPTYEELWTGCGYVAPYLISGASCLSLLMFMTLYCQTICDVWNWFLIESIGVEKDSPLGDPFCIHGIMTFLVFLPFIIRREKSFLYICGWLKISLLLFLTGLCIYCCYTGQSSDLNEGKKAVMFDTGEDWGSAVTGLTGTYTVYMVLFPSLNGMIDMCYRRCVRVLTWSFVIFFVWNQLLMLIQYFTLYDNRTTSLLFSELIGNEWVIRSGSVMFFLIIVLSFPLYLDSARVSSLQIVYIIAPVSSYPNFVWINFGVVWLLCCLLVSTITDSRIIKIFSILGQIVTSLLQFIMPALMLIRCMPSLHKAHWIGIALLLLYGGSLIGYLLATFKDV